MSKPSLDSFEGVFNMVNLLSLVGLVGVGVWLYSSWQEEKKAAVSKINEDDYLDAPDQHSQSSAGQ